MNIKHLKIFIITALIIIPLGVFGASNNNEQILIAENDVVSGNLLAASKNITVDGTVSGDVIAAAQSITINGRVEGDVLAVAQNVVVNGEVGGNIRVLGNSVTINSQVARNVNAFGADIVISKDARIGWDAMLFASSAQIKGAITGGLTAYVQNVIISGKIGKNADLKTYDKNQAQRIIITKESIINGDLNYTSTTRAEIESGANISGQINYQAPIIQKKNNVSAWIWARVFSILSMILIGLIFLFITTKHTNNILKTLKTKPAKSFLIGAIIFLIIPPLAIVLAITIIGLPLAAILLSLWLAGMFLAKTMVAIFMGNLLIKDLIKKPQTPLFWSLIFGTFIMSILFSLPVVGWIISLLTIWLGLGGFLFYVTNQSKNI
ncbi:MAG: polymer-forming cytoskeletal protein [Candidatus Falkowbacteria bacterium]|nr:MAG: polymer-forming cytoskeletal protein [Candidatus Falkowbacteria bacterium]